MIQYNESWKLFKYGLWEFVGLRDMLRLSIAFQGLCRFIDNWTTEFQQGVILAMSMDVRTRLTDNQVWLKYGGS